MEAGEAGLPAATRQGVAGTPLPRGLSKRGRCRPPLLRGAREKAKLPVPKGEPAPSSGALPIQARPRGDRRPVLVRAPVERGWSGGTTGIFGILIHARWVISPRRT